MTEEKFSFAFLLHFRALIPQLPSSAGALWTCPFCDCHGGCGLWSLDDILPPEEGWSVPHGDVDPIPSTTSVCVPRDWLSHLHPKGKVGLSLL